MSYVRVLRGSYDAAVVRAVIFDFDGVMTDNTVIVDQNGVESVVCSRGDGLGIGRLQAAGVQLGVLSKEKNPVVAARCAKLKLPHKQGVDEKLPELKRWLAELGVAREHAAYVGNDVNDLECLSWVGVPIVVADAEPQVLASAALVTTRPGGRGAVRDVCEWILAGRLRSPAGG
jgi:YrbI family 3-deoxy-D-manno-octulosonate 8-phosphate phosphatase